MPPKRTTAKSTKNVPSHRVSTRVAANAIPPVTVPQAPSHDNEEIIDIDAELPDLTDTDEAMAESDNPSGGPILKNAAPSVPSELATTQGRTAYDVRYFFPLYNEACRLTNSQ
jgi:hypothetical protein